MVEEEEGEVVVTWIPDALAANALGLRRNKEASTSKTDGRSEIRQVLAGRPHLRLELLHPLQVPTYRSGLRTGEKPTSPSSSPEPG